ncbi:MAG: NotI family restriction endonuclease [Bacillota bacterium]
MAQRCPFLDRKCLKSRKSEPKITIGTCTMIYGRQPQPVMICPFRLLERSQIFTDCAHLLKLHEPGNELRVVAELAVPGGSIDYCLVSVRDGKPRDFVGVELQTLDTTGTVWPERQRFLRQHKVRVRREDATSEKAFGMNWKMTAKTILVQLNHKIATFEHLCKHLVLVLQDCLLDYMRREFAFNHIKGVRDGDSMQFHAYELRREATAYTLKLKERISTDAAGIAMCLGLQADTKVELQTMLEQIEAKLLQSTLLTVGGGPVPVPEITAIEAEEN